MRLFVRNSVAFSIYRVVLYFENIFLFDCCISVEFVLLSGTLISILLNSYM